MQVGPARLGRRVVRGVADEQVAEAEAVSPNVSLLGCDELLANQPGEARRHLRLVGDECLDGPTVKDLALDRCALEHGPLGLLEPVQAGRQEHLQRRRDDYLAVAGHRQHLADEERVAAGRARDPLTQRVGDGFRNEQLDLGSGSASIRNEIGQVGRRSASSGRPRQRSRRGEPEERSATCSTRSRKYCSPRWM